MTLGYFLLSLFLAGGLTAQAPEIGTIDFYGLHRVPQDRLRKALGVKEGDQLPKSRGDLEEALEQVSGVTRANVEAQCCEGGKAILYIGIEEKNGPHLELREAPDKDLSLPEDVTSAYAEFLQTFAHAESKAEDFREGHAMADDVNTRIIQERFIGLADLHLDELHDVLRNADDGELRAVAACVLGYATVKRKLVEDLQYAMRDPEANVRLNAMRSLTAIAVFARQDPEQGIKVTPTWFVQALSSLEWKPRYQAALSLDALTETRDEKVLSQVRESAVPALIEMAGWKSLTHALPAYVVLGRAAGIDEKSLLELWAKGRRSEVLGRAKKLLK